MKTITLKGFIHCQPARFESGHTVDGMEYTFWRFEDMKSSGYALVAPHNITFELPEQFSPNDQFIAGLEAEKQKLRAEFQNRITEIERQISQLQAIEFTA